MGYYIEGPTIGKAEYIIKKYGGVRITEEEALDVILSDKEQAVICVVGNVTFEAAGFCYNESEFDEFSLSYDTRPKVWLRMSRKKAKELTHFIGD